MSNPSRETQEKATSDLLKKKHSTQNPQTNEPLHSSQTTQPKYTSTTASFDDDSSKSVSISDPMIAAKGGFSSKVTVGKNYSPPSTQSKTGKGPVDPGREDLSQKEGTSTSHVTAGTVSDVPCFDTSMMASSGDDLKPALARAQLPESTLTPTGSTTIAFKLLVSNNMAGSIIGKSGKTISDLQSQSSSRIKLSQNGICYPGTTDRVCLIQGPIDNVKLALNLILQQLHDLYRQQITQQTSGDSIPLSSRRGPSTNLSQNPLLENQDNFEFLRESETANPSQTQSQDVISPDESESLHSKPLSNKASFVVRVLIPIACSGLIIGRAGCTVKSIAETSGVSSIRLAPKEGDEFQQTVISSMQQQQTPSLLLIPHQQTTSERIVTITAHDLSSCIKCCHLILDTMVLQPDLSRYINMTTNYSKPTAANAAFLTSTQTTLPDNIASFVGAPSSDFTSSIASAQQQQQQSSVVIPTGTFSPSDTSAIRLSSTQPPPNIGLTGPISHQYPSNILRYNSGNYFTNTDQPVSSQSSTSIILPTNQMISSLNREPGSYSQTHHQPPVSPSLYLVASPSSSGGMFVPATAQTLGPNVASANHPRQTGDTVLSGTGMQTNQYLESHKVSQVSFEDQGNLQITQQFASSHQYVPTNRNRDDKQVLQSESSARGGDSINTQGGRQQFTRQMAVPDFLIGSILGPGGETLSELQITTNTNIKISQRGVFIPGTNDRIVTITGPTMLNVSNAQYFITQRLARSASRNSPQSDSAARSSPYSKKQFYSRSEDPS